MHTLTPYVVGSVCKIQFNICISSMPKRPGRGMMLMACQFSSLSVRQVLLCEIGLYVCCGCWQVPVLPGSYNEYAPRVLASSHRIINDFITAHSPTQ